MSRGGTPQLLRTDAPELRTLQTLPWVSLHLAGNLYPLLYPLLCNKRVNTSVSLSSMRNLGGPGNTDL